MRRNAVAAAELFVTLLLLSIPAAQALNLNFAQCGLRDVHYKVIDLGVFQTESSAIAINDVDQVAGSSPGITGGSRAFLWECDSGLEDIGSLDTSLGGNSQPYDLNNRGDIVGYSSTLNGIGASAFIWNRRQGIRPVGTDSARGYDINDFREVMVSNEGGDIHEGPSIWSARLGSRFLHELFGFEPVGEPRINNLRVLGGARATNEGFRFFHWTPRRGVVDIATWTGSAFGVLTEKMNDRGDILTTIYGVDGIDGQHILALATQDDGIKVLADRVDFNSFALALNNKRQVVLILASVWHLWDEQNGLRPLSDLVSGTPLDSMTAQAWGINNWGWMVGTRYVPETNSVHATLFVPVPNGTTRFDNLPQLSGGALCKVLQAVKVEAIRSCLFEGK